MPVFFGSQPALGTGTITGGKGISIVDRDGREMIDAFAGLYCVNIGYGRTEIAEASRNQPESAAPPALYEPTEEQQAAQAFVKAAIDGGMEPDAVADLVHDAIVNNRFWIFTDLGMVEMLREKHASIVENRNPQIFGIVDLD